MDKVRAPTVKHTVVESRTFNVYSFEDDIDAPRTIELEALSARVKRS